MKPQEYLKLTGENPGAFSKRSGIPQPTIWRHIKGKVKYVTPRIIKLWRKHSNGAVTTEDLLDLS